MADHYPSQDHQASGVSCGRDTSGCTVDSVPNFIRKRAHELFEARHREPGHELDDWLQAEREIKHHLGV